MAQQRVRLVVRYTGRVQGVGFRFNAVAQSRQLDVHGFVRNEPDGSVLMDVEGPREDVREIVRRIETTMEDFIGQATIDERTPAGATGGFEVGY